MGHLNYIYLRCMPKPMKLISVFKYGSAKVHIACLMQDETVRWFGGRHELPDSSAICSSIVTDQPQHECFAIRCPALQNWRDNSNLGSKLSKPKGGAMSQESCIVVGSLDSLHCQLSTKVNLMTILIPWYTHTG